MCIADADPISFAAVSRLAGEFQPSIRLSFRKDSWQKINAAESLTLQGGRLPIMDTLPYRCSPVIHGCPFRVAARHILTLLPVIMLLAVGCGKPNAVSAMQSPDVEVASVVQKDVPIF